ncbi:MAG: site-specific integrase [Deltaproteobacteria bacterium]|nr:site-specific integrase [Deltaproteobacteria bacterium]
MGKLHTRMEEEMVLRGLRSRTRQVYLAAVRKFIEFHGQSPRNLGTEEIRAYTVHLLQERRLSRSSANQAVCAIKFFYSNVLKRSEEVAEIRVRRRRGKKLPTIMTRAEVGRILSATENRIYQTLFMTLYATGLRIGEGCRLQVGDINRESMRISVRDGKGGNDRTVLLSPRLLSILETYWWSYRPRLWLFARGGAATPLPVRSSQRAFQRSVALAGIAKRVSVHSLRHAFATHLLEQGTSIRYIQELLGHRNLSSTVIYTRVTDSQTSGVRSPFDSLVYEAPQLFR